MATVTQREVEGSGGVVEYTLSNGGLEARVLSYGATLTSLLAPDREGVLGEVTLCHETLTELQTKPGPYFGCIAGRYANRIKDGAFSIDGQSFSLARNNGPNALHGGLEGFDKKTWSGKAVVDHRGASVELRYTSPDGEEGYPGALTVTVTYTLAADSVAENAHPTLFPAPPPSTPRLVISFHAAATRPTPINLTNHAYWNLSGSCRLSPDPAASLALHTLHLPRCSTYLPVDGNQIPTGGAAAAVADTPFDFLSPATLGPDRLGLIDGGGRLGLDHCFCVDPLLPSAPSSDTLPLAAVLAHAPSGRRLSLYASQPGLQVYTSNWLATEAAEAPFVQHGAVCLETQHYPDAPNQAWMPACILRPGEEYRQHSVFVFDCM